MIATHLGAIGFAHAQSPDLLWYIVSDQCVPDQAQHGDPKPCASVDLKDGYAILKDIRGRTQYLLIPTVRVTGIESPDLLTPEAPNYFAYAWGARGYVERAAGRTLPRSALSLAINSANARSQNQLHIHMDCIRPDVHQVLERDLAKIGDSWAPLPQPLVGGHHYRAMRVVADTLEGANPFMLLADGVPGARADMGKENLVVVGAEFAAGQPGFVILNSQVDPSTGNTAGGEELQDHDCAIGN